MGSRFEGVTYHSGEGSVGGRGLRQLYLWVLLCSQEAERDDCYTQRIHFHFFSLDRAYQDDTAHVYSGSSHSSQPN